MDFKAWVENLSATDPAKETLAELLHLGLRARQATLQSGEAIFIPAGWFVACAVLQDSIAYGTRQAVVPVCKASVECLEKLAKAFSSHAAASKLLNTAVDGLELALTS